jgi:succinate-semialdehyde dehydrogenase/glutarate-semialdehyde dehydrogenase
MYEELGLYIGGTWRGGAGGRTLPVLNPADDSVLGVLPLAGPADLDAALAAAQEGFQAWRAHSAFEREAVLRRAARLLEERAVAIAEVMTLEQGKPLAEARGEMARVAETFDWFAGEASRALGRVYPQRSAELRQASVPEPLGVTLALTAWNFPAILPARKLAPALAAGCSVILKAAEETPGTAVALVRALADAGLPAGAVNLVFGEPAQVSEHLLASPVVRKMSFTGSVPVGKTLARLAGAGLKRCTLELGGHAPVVVRADADLDRTVAATAAFKYRNAGQVCLAPSRFYVHEDIYEAFVARFAAQADALKVGPGTETGIDMGPMANARRIEAMSRLVEDATGRGARLLAGGERIGGRGCFFAPTVLADVPEDAAVMREEPFGPIAPIAPFRDDADALARANALPFGLAAYVFTGSARAMELYADRLEAGSVGVNTMTPAQPDTPLGGVKESGYGYEGGHEGLEAFVHQKLVSHGPAPE